MAGSGRKTHPEGREWSEGHPRGMGGVNRDRRCQEALWDNQEESRGLGEVGRLPEGLGGARRDGRGQQALPEGWEVSGVSSG